MTSGGITFLVGGARAGKSAYAERMARAHGRPVTVIATAEAGDADMASRIARHRAERPANWTTIEEPHDLAGALARVALDATVIVDCLTLWTTNRILGGDDDVSVGEACRTTIDVATARVGSTIVVSNEVGLGVVPASDLGRHFQDLHGRVNQAWASAATQAFFIVAGRALELQ